MTIVSTPSLVDALRQSRLLEPAQFDELTRTLQGRFADPRILARELLQRGWLTPFQINQLFQGKGAELVLGSYVLLERIGEGGMGQVFEARHPRMGRVVALKLIRKDRLANPLAGLRFEQEIKAAAKLAHPNVVTAYDAAQVGDTHFFVMEYVEGTDLAKLIHDSGPLPVEQACAYIRQAACGLAHAHEKGMVHRDIKPSNLLLAVKEGLVKILDMGLARLPAEGNGDDTGSLTETGAVVGTPDYAAPEQIREAQRADIRSDLYSLGCTLYFLLTGRPPFATGTIGEKLVKHQLEEPEPVEKLNPEVPAGLAAIIRKLMAKRPEDRFQTPAEVAHVFETGLQTGSWPLSALPSGTVRMARPRTGVAPPAGPLPPVLEPDSTVALSRWTAFRNHPVTATAMSWAHRLRHTPEGQKWLRLRGRGGAVLLALALLVLVCIVWLGLRGRSPLDRLSGSNISAEDRIAAGNLEGLVGVWGDQRLRHWGAARYVAFSPDGAAVASAGDDRTVYVWDIATGKPQQAFLHPDSARSPMFVADGRLVLTRLAYGPCKLWDRATGNDVPVPTGVLLGVTLDGTTAAIRDEGGRGVKLWDLGTGKERLRLDGLSGVIQSWSMTADGQTAAAGGHDGSLVVWNTASGKVVANLKGHTRSVPHMALCLDGKGVISWSEDTAAFRLWDVSAEKERTAFPKGHSPWLISPDGKTLAWRDRDTLQSVHLADLVTGKERPVLKHSTLEALAFSADSRLLAIGGTSDVPIKIWDLASGTARASIKGASGFVSGLAFTGDGRTLAAACADGTIHLWDLASGSENQPAPNRDWYTNCVFSHDGKQMALLQRNAIVKLWDLAAGKERVTLRGHNGVITSVAFSPDDLTLATSATDGYVKLWDTASGQLQTTLSNNRDLVSAVVFAPDGKTVAAAGQTTVQLSDTASGRQLALLQGPKSGLTGLAYAPNGKTLAASTAEGTLLLWDARSHHLTNTFTGLKGRTSVGFSPDGQLLIGRSEDGALVLWDASSFKEQSTFAPVSAWALASDGKNLAAGYHDGLVKTWDLATRQVRTPLEGHTRQVNLAAYSPNGRLLASLDVACQLILWEPASRKKKLTEWHMPGAVSRLFFAPDGRHLVTVNNNGTVYVLRVTSFMK